MESGRALVETYRGRFLRRKAPPLFSTSRAARLDCNVGEALPHWGAGGRVVLRGMAPRMPMGATWAPIHTTS
jgi:hypothetical protein